MVHSLVEHIFFLESSAYRKCRCDCCKVPKRRRRKVPSYFGTLRYTYWRIEKGEWKDSTTIYTPEVTCVLGFVNQRAASFMLLSLEEKTQLLPSGSRFLCFVLGYSVAVKSKKWNLFVAKYFVWLQLLHYYRKHF